MSENEKEDENESSVRVIEWDLIHFAQSGMLHWINRQTWPLGFQLWLDIPSGPDGADITKARLTVLGTEPFSPIALRGDPDIEEVMLERALLWIAGRVNSVIAPPVVGEGTESPPETDAPEPSQEDGSPAGPVH